MPVPARPLCLRRRKEAVSSSSASVALSAGLVDTETARGAITSLLPLPPPPAAAMPSLVAIAQGTEGKGDLLEAAGTFTLDWLNNVNYGAVFALSLFPYLIFLKNIWPEDYPIPKVGGGKKRKRGRESRKERGREGGK